MQIVTLLRYGNIWCIIIKINLHGILWQVKKVWSYLVKDIYQRTRTEKKEIEIQNKRSWIADKELGGIQKRETGTQNGVDRE